MAIETKVPLTSDGRAIDVDQAMAEIEKGQQLAGHFPSAEDLDRARRVLAGELAPAAARVEMSEALARLVAEERDGAHER